MKKTLVLGASPNPQRYAYIATKRLLAKGHEVVLVGVRKDAMIDGIAIQTGQPTVNDVDTVTLYLNSTRQEAYYDYIISLKPKRIIFNPGTENTELMRLAKINNIESVVACTLVMLSTDQY